MHIHWNTKTFLLRVTVTLTVTHDSTGTKFTQWTDSTNFRPTAPVVHRFTGGFPMC